MRRVLIASISTVSLCAPLLAVPLSPTAFAAPTTQCTTTGPWITTAPQDTTTKAGSMVTLKASITTPEGAEIPTFTWQYSPANVNLWATITDGEEGFSIKTVSGGHSYLSFPVTSAMNGAKIRLLATNSQGTTCSQAAILTVGEPAPRTADVELHEVSAAWNLAKIFQMQNYRNQVDYFSAGKSDGTENTYQTTDRNVRVLFEDGPSPTWETRDASVNRESTQYVKLSNGKGVLKPDGSGEVRWEGTVSLNLGHGKAPFYFTNPVLTVNADKTAKLTATFGGYTEADKQLLGEKPNQTLATFSNVDLIPDGELTLQPDFDTVIAPTNPDGSSIPQKTSGVHWGSWPADVVEFHYATGLADYWYSIDNSDVDYFGKKPSAISLSIKSVKKTDPAPTDIPPQHQFGTGESGADDGGNSATNPDSKTNTTPQTNGENKSDGSDEKTNPDSDRKARKIPGSSQQNQKRGLLGLLLRYAPFILGIGALGVYAASTVNPPA
ncbi:MAG: hypothetical protein Q3962_00760 [Corynebacterium sp.]|nr:hypothetical protein [Corynebacterium sp.]